MADDGTKFAWNDDAGDWQEVEGNEEEELEDDQEEVTMLTIIRRYLCLRYDYFCAGGTARCSP